MSARPWLIPYLWLLLVAAGAPKFSHAQQSSDSGGAYRIGADEGAAPDFVEPKVRELRQGIVDDMLRAELVTAVNQGPRGILRVSVGPRFYHARSRESSFDRLARAYQAWTDPGNSVLIEVWDHGVKFGEFADGVFTFGPRFSTPRECSSFETLCVQAVVGDTQPAPSLSQVSALSDGASSSPGAAEPNPPESEPPGLPIDSLVQPVSETTSVQPAVPARADPPEGAPPRQTRNRPAGFYGTIGAGGTDAGNVSGFAVTAGIGVRAGPLLFAVNAMDVTLSRGDSGPYYRDEFSNGQSRCRNGENGQFAEDSKCIAIDANYAASADLNLVIPSTPVFLGGGGRVAGDNELWYGSIGAAWGRNARRMWIARANFGKDYVSGLVSVGFHF
jgi:hypothetical protein